MQGLFSGRAAFSWLVAIGTILAGMIGVGNIMLIIVKERTKEIGVRKVLGASITNVWQMLSKEFIGLVLLGSALAIPLASYMMQQWLNDYEYRTEISWSLYGYAALGAVLVTLLTVSVQTLRAAQNNPIKSLRTE